MYYVYVVKHSTWQQFLPTQLYEENRANDMQLTCFMQCLYRLFIQTRHFLSLATSRSMSVVIGELGPNCPLIFFVSCETLNSLVLQRNNRCLILSSIQYCSNRQIWGWAEQLHLLFTSKDSKNSILEYFSTDRNFHCISI